MVWYIIGVNIIIRTLHGRLEIYYMVAWRYIMEINPCQSLCPALLHLSIFGILELFFNLAFIYFQFLVNCVMRSPKRQNINSLVCTCLLYVFLNHY